jgi:hypothetical protein
MSPAETFPDGTTHRRYDVLTADGEWMATVFVCADGIFATHSDYGCYSHYWGSTECDIREFLLRSVDDPRYFLTCFSPRMEFDCDATVKAIREHIATLPPERQRVEQANADELESGKDFRLWMAETRIDYPWELARECHNKRAVRFVERVMPRLCELLRAELAAESKAA